MGKRAKLKKMSRQGEIASERLLIEERRRQARTPMRRLFKRLAVAVVVTIVLFYIGQVVNQRLAHAAVNVEATK